jgi:hypothetical protein
VSCLFIEQTYKVDFKVILSLCLIKHYVISVYGVVKWQLPAYLTCHVYEVDCRMKYKIIRSTYLL